MNADQIRVGSTYRAKRFKEFMGWTNDRVVLYISPNRSRVQYDSGTVGAGRHYPTVAMDKFLRWAKEEIIGKSK